MRALQRGPEAEDDDKSQSLLAESSQTMQVVKTMMTTTLISLLNLNFYFKNVFLFLK